MNKYTRNKQKLHQVVAKFKNDKIAKEWGNNNNPIKNREYSNFFNSIKDRVRKTQQRAILGINKELIILYWDIGRMILHKQKRKGWGSKVIDYLSLDLCHEFPEIKGFSVRNLKYMRNFAKEYPDFAFVQQVAAQLPWFHNCILIERVPDIEERRWFLHKCLAHGWSRNVLIHQIDSGLFRRQGKAITNFDQTLPQTNSDLAHQTLKDPYIFDFLCLGPEAQERNLERGLLDNIRDFLLELGEGFSFVGSQYHMEVGGDDFYIDLLFYHLKLRCFVVVDLKMGEFMPEYAGKMNFYLSAIDDKLRHPNDKRSIGLILCKTRNRLVAEYTMRDLKKPIGVATYRLPKRILSKLPDLKMFEKSFRKNKHKR